MSGFTQTIENEEANEVSEYSAEINKIPMLCLEQNKDKEIYKPMKN